MRGQLSLPALGVALLVLTAATFVAVVVAGGAVTATDRASLDRQAAVALSDRLAAADAPLTLRANVLNRSRLDALTVAALRERYGLAPDASVRVALGNRTLAATGDPDGATVRRLVLVGQTGRRTLTPAFTAGPQVTLPRRTERVRLRLTPPPNTTVTRVRANGRVVLADPDGLRGSETVVVSPYETTTLRFDASGSLPRGSVRVTYYPERTHKRQLVVTVDG